MAAATDLYLPDECWEHIFKFFNCYGYSDNYYNSYLKSLSIVSKQFLSITNRLKLSLMIRDTTLPFLGQLFQSCPKLLQLDLAHCHYVTDKGLNHVVENCTQPRELNLRNCDNVHRDVLASLILSRPSLRKLTIPYRDDFSDQEMELLSRQRQGMHCLLVFENCFIVV
ncbi:putative leucine-rich repeat domain, L domain-containing protein [Medicago truncatula]|uniref:Putative leucine-rich repeat domain, L domain-containing protein n=1 Tax=Medicago truncatula TaxID=3880 RepID=A0A396JE19_MEDTR|nr:putative leucine-rich repeat domain, L domain-containing protein [Medicago truncatula]